MMRKLTPVLSGVALVTLSACSRAAGGRATGATRGAGGPACPARRARHDGTGRPGAGSQDVEIRARVEGFLETVAFTEGSLVKKGQLLYQIDPKPLAGRRSPTRRPTSRRGRRRLEKTNNDVKRYTPLVASSRR